MAWMVIGTPLAVWVAAATHSRVLRHWMTVERGVMGVGWMMMVTWVHLAVWVMR